MALSLTRKKTVKSIARFALATVMLSICTVFLTIGTFPLPVQAAGIQKLDNRKIIDLINAYRDRKGLSVLRRNSKLGKSTDFKIKDMARQSYFAHTNPEGRPFHHNVEKAKYDYGSVAEVLAKGCRNEEQVLQLWAKSPSHNKALLDSRFSEINCSSSYYRGLTYVACHLATPRIWKSN